MVPFLSLCSMSAPFARRRLTSSEWPPAQAKVSAVSWLLSVCESTSNVDWYRLPCWKQEKKHQHKNYTNAASMTNNLNHFKYYVFEHACHPMKTLWKILDLRHHVVKTQTKQIGMHLFVYNINWQNFRNKHMIFSKFPWPIVNMHANKHQTHTDTHLNKAMTEHSECVNESVGKDLLLNL